MYRVMDLWNEEEFIPRNYFVKLEISNFLEILFDCYDLV